MEDRYEIKGKIGQGGLGSVYKAHDIRMNREVAIKRIIANSEDSSLPEEATRQLIKEAGSLASLQHPNIVTIYDVGTDDDGPFVVMELLSGDTLEEIIGKGSFTWQDFRQLATQVLEALIAAQELHLVHRDLKPSNIMLTWLPSGKFQVKIVDFGLAKLSSKPSLQTIDQSDGVFGSIYFMAPEQFERVPIDLKADLYAIGCVFYYALTGTYPFDGETAAEVMASHLQHHITPLQEVRDGIPLWACDWIMWHLNRLPSDRPESARQSLQVFNENDVQASPPLSTGSPAPAVEQPKRPRLLVPGAAPVPQVVPDPTPTQPVKTAAAPKPLAPPQGSKPSVHTTAHVVQTAPHSTPESPAAETDDAEPEPTGDAEEAQSNAPEPTQEAVAPASQEPKTKSAPMLVRAKAAPGSAAPTLTKAGGAAPSLTKQAAAKPSPISTQPLKPAVAATSPLVPKVASVPTAKAAKTAPTPLQKQKKGISSGLKAMIAVILGLLVVVLAVIMLKKSGDNAETKVYNDMIAIAKEENATELPVDKRKFDILLRNAVTTGRNEQREVVYKALYLAKSTDGTDIDRTLAEFVTTKEMIPDVRNVILRNVLRKRNNPAIIGTLLAFARSTDDTNAAISAIEGTRFMSTDEHFQTFIDIINTTTSEPIRKAAEGNAAKIIEKSSSKASLGETLISTYDSASSDVIRHTMLRLIGGIGGEKSLEVAKRSLNSDQVEDKIAAIVALGQWSDRSGFKTLVNFLGTSPELDLRNRAYEAAYQYAMKATDDTEEIWALMGTESKTQEEQLKLVRGLANVDPAPWAYTALGEIVSTSDSDKVIDLAERAIVRLKDIEKTKAAPQPEGATPADEQIEE